MDQDKCKCQHLPLILEDNFFDCSCLFDIVFQLQSCMAHRSSEGKRNSKRTWKSGEWVLKYINTGINTGNVILRVTVFVFNTESDVYPNSCPVGSMCCPQDLAEKGESRKDPSLQALVSVPNFWALPSCGCCTPHLAVRIQC